MVMFAWGKIRSDARGASAPASWPAAMTHGAGETHWAKAVRISAGGSRAEGQGTEGELERDQVVQMRAVNGYNPPNAQPGHPGLKAIRGARGDDLPSEPPLTALVGNRRTSKVRRIETYADLKAAHVTLDKVLGVNWNLGSLCESTDTRSEIAAVLERDGSAVLLYTDGAENGLLAQLRRELEKHRTPTKRTVRTVTTVLAHLYAEATRLNQARTTANSLEGEAASLAAFKELVRLGEEKGASDLDVNCFPDRAEVWFRIDGFRLQSTPLHARTGRNIISHVYSSRLVESTSRSESTYYPGGRQHALVKLDMPDGSARELRMQTMGGRDGSPNGNWRYVANGAGKRKFERLAQMGFSPQQEGEIVRSVSYPDGLMLFLGATGQGKTTTLDLAMTQHPDISWIKVVEVADPPEIDNPRIIKHPVQRHGSASEASDEEYLKSLKAALRFDPDNLLIGEIRDQKTAEFAVHAALTGHMTIGTMHTKEPFGAYQRLLEMGVPSSVLFDDGFVRGFVQQILRPIICKQCSQQVSRTSHLFSELVELQERYELDDEVINRIRHRGPGCSLCRGPSEGALAGYRRGRTVCASVLTPSPAILNAFKSDRVHGITKGRTAFRQSRVAAFDEEGTDGKTVLEHMLFKVTQGDICFADYLKEAGPVRSHDIIIVKGRP